MHRLALASLVFAVAATPAGADEYGRSGFDLRYSQQMRAIEDGRREGSITFSEGNRLRALQRNIIATRKHLLTDGYLSPDDRRLLRRMQDEAGDEIAELGTNRRKRAWFAPRFGR
jgi:hypothetical protein